VEDCAAEQAEDCSGQEHHDRPSGDLVRVGLMLMQLQYLELLRIHFFLQLLDFLLEAV